jgi:hypothetical protein
VRCAGLGPGDTPMDKQLRQLAFFTFPLFRDVAEFARKIVL